MHFTRPAELYEPGVHGAGVTVPWAHASPAVHMLHCTVPGSAAKRPAGQSTHRTFEVGRKEKCERRKQVAYESD